MAGHRPFGRVDQTAAKAKTGTRVREVHDKARVSRAQDSWAQINRSRDKGKDVSLDADPACAAILESCASSGRMGKS